MSRATWVRLSCGFTLAAVIAAWPAFALASAPSAERVQAAAAEFDEGRVLFRNDQFEDAGMHFETAYRDAPTVEALRLAIRSFRSAGTVWRAANLATEAQAAFPADEPMIKLAAETLADVHEVAQVRLRCAEPCALLLDGRVFSFAAAKEHRFFLEPGNHTVLASFAKRGEISIRIEAARGAEFSKDVAPPALPPPDPDAQNGVDKPSLPEPKRLESKPRAHRPLPRGIFFTGLGLTTAVGGASLASYLIARSDPGVDTVRRECAGKDESCPAYARGRDADMRTNVLLGVAGGLGLLTAISAIFTEFSPSSRRDQAAIYVVPFGAGLGLVGRY